LKAGNKSNILTRLKRAQGHLASTIKMIEEENDVLTTVHQLHAVLKALERTKHIAIIDYIENEIVESDSTAPDNSTHQLSTLTKLTKYL
jgi:DNA-binding FrmR family transcriptional regulator